MHEYCCYDSFKSIMCCSKPLCRPLSDHKCPQFVSLCAHKLIMPCRCVSMSMTQITSRSLRPPARACSQMPRPSAASWKSGLPLPMARSAALAATCLTDQIIYQQYNYAVTSHYLTAHCTGNQCCCASKKSCASMHLSLSQDCVASDKAHACSHIQFIQRKYVLWQYTTLLLHLHTAACMQYLANNFGTPSIANALTGALGCTHINQPLRQRTLIMHHE